MQRKDPKAIESRERRVTVKKRMCVLFITLLLTLMLALPASASKPTEVSGIRVGTVDMGSRVWRSAGKNCILDADATYTFTGDLDGTAPAHLRIVSHGPCGPNGPIKFAYYETIKIQGTFTGDVLDTGGTFDFSETGKVRPVDPGEVLWSSRMVVLSGSGGLANLHGLVDVTLVKGQPPATYSGQVHFDPQP
jgi:hypothetical protein